MNDRNNRLSKTGRVRQCAYCKDWVDSKHVRRTRLTDKRSPQSRFFSSSLLLVLFQFFLFLSFFFFFSSLFHTSLTHTFYLCVIMCVCARLFFSFCFNTINIDHHLTIIIICCDSFCHPLSLFLSLSLSPLPFSYYMPSPFTDTSGLEYSLHGG